MDRTRSDENLLKNDVRIQRLEEDIPNLREVYLDRTATFHQGKFLGWQEDVEYDPVITRCLKFAHAGRDIDRV